MRKKSFIIIMFNFIIYIVITSYSQVIAVETYRDMLLVEDMDTNFETNQETDKLVSKSFFHLNNENLKRSVSDWDIYTMVNDELVELILTNDYIDEQNNYNRMVPKKDTFVSSS